MRNAAFSTLVIAAGMNLLMPLYPQRDSRGPSTCTASANFEPIKRLGVATGTAVAPTTVPTIPCYKISPTAKHYERGNRYSKTMLAVPSNTLLYFLNAPARRNALRATALGCQYSSPTLLVHPTQFPLSQTDHECCLIQTAPTLPTNILRVFVTRTDKVTLVKSQAYIYIGDSLPEDHS
ncbi:hypothetical protein BGW80DRAFT_1249928 [Lactifluus volemus]|nr:hypothetical protein BGW80DRAFT_1249928 [Lactifluus volemus]